MNTAAGSKIDSLSYKANLRAMFMEVRALNRSRLLLTLQIVHCILIRMGSPYQSDSMGRTPDVCEEICNRKILHFLYYCKYGVLFFDNDGTGPTDESKRTKRIQGGSRQIMWGGFYYLQYYYFVK